MVTFCFDSFGKLKLIISRLEKLSSEVSLNLYQDSCRFICDNICLESFNVSVTDGVLPTDGIRIKINFTNLHNITKNIPAINRCFLRLEGKFLYIITDSLRKKKSVRQNSCKIAVVREDICQYDNRFDVINKLDNIYSSNNKVSMNISNIIWSLERLHHCFEKMEFELNEDNMTIKANCNEYKGESVVKYLDSYNIGNHVLDVTSASVIKRFWLLELAASNCKFFIDPKSLEVCVSSKSEDENILIFLD